jgi:hypothetical protein
VTFGVKKWLRTYTRDQYKNKKMDNMEMMMQQILAQKDANQEKAEARMAKLEKIEETMERQTKHLMMAKWNTHQEMTETDPDTQMMQSAVVHQ